MNALVKFYAITTTLATVVTATLPAEAAMFQIGGTAMSQNGEEQVLSGTFNETLTDYKFTVNGGTYLNTDNSVYNTRGFNSTDNFDSRRYGHAWSVFSKLNIFSDDTLKVDLNALLEAKPGETLSVFWQQFGVRDTVGGYYYMAGTIDSKDYNTAGFGTATISMLPSLDSEPVPEPGELLGIAGAGAMLLGGVFLQRRKLAKS